MAEIPLVYPNHVYQPRRYVVDGLTGSVTREAAVSPVSRGESSFSVGDDHGSSPIFEEALPGSASVSELDLRGKSFLLTTSAKMEDPEILSVSLSSTTTTAYLRSPSMLELDYRQLEMQPLVSVVAFAQGSSWIRLTLVDCEGTFLSILLTDQLVPVSSGDQPSVIQVLKTTDYIKELAILQEVTGSELQSTMVAFANPTTAIMALSPFLITVDLENARSYVWSETQCLEDMKARSSSLGSLLTNVSDLILGKLNEGVMDMSPTAALCLSTTPNPLLDDSYCITLHSDSSIRKWKLDMSASPIPLEVVSLDASKLPLPSTWSDARNSVSLCARMYDQTYAVGVHIRTQGYFDAEDMEDDSQADDENQSSATSDCHLWVFHGNPREVEGSRHACMSLSVPKQALSLVGMSFSPTASRCSFSVIFECSNLDLNNSGTIHVTYPPSIMSIVSPEPKVMGHGSLDKVANHERSRIRSMLLGPSLLGSMEDSTVEEILHEMDSWYLKYLFRPMFPRGTGTVLPPTAGCIRRAMAKLVPGSSKGKKIGMSIELELIRTMYELRQRDLRKLSVARTPSRKSNRPSPRAQESPVVIADATTPYSLYDSFVQDAGNDEEEMEIDENAEDNWEKLEQERSAEVEAHEKRWRRLLLQVWEEEQVNRMPLLVKWLSSQPLQVIVRSGLTTVMEDSPPTHEAISSSWGTTLDGFALKLLNLIEQDKECCSRLYAVEQRVSTIIAKAQLALEPLGKDFADDLTALARWAWSKGDESDGISDEEHERLEDTMSGLSSSELVNWIQATPTNSMGSLPGLEIIATGGAHSASGTTWSQRQVANYQLRHSACTLALRCIDSVRRLQLGRSLLLLDMVEGSHARDAALRAYLHSIAVLWTSSQRVAMPLTTFQSRKPVRLGESSPETASPPNKRLSFGDDATSVLAPLTSTMTTPIDVVTIEISQTMDSTSRVPKSPVGVAIFLTQAYFRLAFSARGDIPIGKPSLLPELGALPRPKDDSIATDYPRLALRLLAPYVAYSLPEDSADVVLSRKESLAECLLIESHASATRGPPQAQMRQIACELLVPKSPSNDNAVVQNNIRTASAALDSLKRNSPIAPVSKEILASTLQQMVPDGTSIEVYRLCELETVKNMFSPLAVGLGHDLDHSTRSSISLVAETLLHLSRVMYRLTILERHVHVRGENDEGESPDVLLSFISTAISDMGKTFPDEVCQVMPEYGKIWGRLFHHSVLAGQWKTAYSACVRNPKSEHRETNFKRLVRAMVDQGALSELLVLCTELGQRISSSSTLSPTEARETVDLYEIASEILAEAVSRDMYSVRATSPEPSSLSDYQGSLYALHASQKHWRRAAQSMDLRFVNAQKALGTRVKGFDFNLQSAELRDGLIVEDLVLASVGSLNAIELVKDDAHKFLVSGEYGPYNRIAVGDLEGDMSTSAATSKRTRGPFGIASEEKSTDDEDRLSNFMTRVELGGRAIRSIALRTLFFDRSTDPTFAKSALLRHIDSSKLDIDSLFQYGYMQHGLLLAKAWAKNREAETGSSKPEGSDLFSDCLSHMFEIYLIPKALGSCSQAVRPTLDQIHFALDGVGPSAAAASYVAPPRNGRLADVQTAALQMAAMSLVRKLTLAYTTAETPVALEVASLYLESGNTVLPAWLEGFLMGTGAPSSSGLFAPRPRPGPYTYFGDPAGLIALYTKNGLLAEACSIVTSTLLGVDGEGKTREARAASRLPEKGDIDFLPYQSIDMLWNLIDILLSKRVLGDSEEARVKGARDQMETALKKNFALEKISETGMRSARALQ